MAASHTPDTCIQSPTLHQIQRTLDRVAVAMETIAAQGAAVAAHEKRLDTHEKRIERHELHFAELYNRVTAIEKDKARHDGEEAVEDGQKKFWTDVKLRLVGPSITVVFFLIWAIDKTGLAGKLLVLWKEFK